MKKTGIRIRDKVQWISQAAGTYKIKEGKVAFVIPAGVPVDSIMRGIMAKEFTLMFDPGTYPRVDQSYMVVVKDGKHKPKLYWPRTSQLEKV